MRILLLWDYYEPYLAHFYSQCERRDGVGRDATIEALLDDAFGWPAGLIRPWIEAGNFASVVIGNDARTQSLWLEQRGLDPSLFDSDPLGVVAAQVREYRPDVLWVGSCFRYFGDFLGNLRDEVPLIVAWISCPLPAALSLRGLDLVLTSTPGHARQLGTQGVRCELMMPSFNDGVLQRIGPMERDLAVAFAGFLSPERLYRNRSRRVQLLARIGVLDAWGCDAPRNCWPWSRAGALRRSTHGEAWGLDYYRIYARARIGFNCHSILEGYNMRLFEIAGMGALLMTDTHGGLGHLFEDGVEAVEYTSDASLEQLVRYYLAHEEERAEIAAAGQRRVLKEHSASVRSRELLDCFTAMR